MYFTKTNENIHNIVDPLIGIGTLADKVGLSVSSIRKYETAGLIIPHRTDSGHRMFSYEDIIRVRAIQHMIKDLGFNIEGIRRLQALLPCWELLPCNKKTWDKCSAPRDNSKPCWMIKDTHGTFQGIECRDCVVYRFGTLYIEYIKELLHKLSGGCDPESALTEFLYKKREDLEEVK